MQADQATNAVAVKSPADRRARRAKLTLWTERLALPGFWAVLIVVFTSLKPSQFLTAGNISSILGSNSVLLVVALAALVPLMLGDFDLSVGSISGLSAMVVALLNGQHHVPVLISAAVGLLAGLSMGALNAIFIVGFGNDTFIVTLASGTIATGVVYELSSSTTISMSSMNLSQWTFLHTLLGVPLEFYYALVLAVILWYFSRMTSLGQKVLFVGQSRIVAKSSGIHVSRLRSAGFLLSGLIAGLSGVLAVGINGASDPTFGPSLLLPAFASAFLGTTTIQPGRFNPMGTVIAVFFLASGVSGLQLLGAQNYIQDLFYGGALITAVTLSGFVRRGRISPGH